MFDVETLSTESNCVVLSASIIHFDLKEKVSYTELLSKALFVKFDVQSQLQLKRVMDKETLEWWEKQHHHVRKISLTPSSDDIHPKHGIQKLREYVSRYPGDHTIWARGSLDQMAIDSLARSVDEEPIIQYNNWRDIRTAVDLLYESARNGYCEVEHPTFQRYDVIKHHPTHDCALDIMMMMYGK